MALTLPQALAALDEGNIQEADLAHLWKEGSVAPAALLPTQSAGGEPDASTWVRPVSIAELTDRLAAWDAESAVHAAEVEHRRLRPYRKKLKAHLSHWWGWAHRDRLLWGALPLVTLCFAMIGGGLGNAAGHPWVGALLLGAWPLGHILGLLAWAARDGQAGIAPPVDRTIERQALEHWHPEMGDLLMWRSVPAAHRQAVAFLRSPIGLRQGDRAAMDAAYQAGLGTETEAALTQFLAEVP